MGAAAKPWRTSEGTPRGENAEPLLSGVAASLPGSFLDRLQGGAYCRIRRTHPMPRTRRPYFRAAAIALAAVSLGSASMAAVGDAAFPGKNGRIAYEGGDPAPFDASA